MDRISGDAEQFRAEPPSSVEEALRLAARMVWDGINDHAQLLRVIFREPEAFPELLEDSCEPVRSIR
ncbi:MAG: hypothetical protein JO152_10815 [Mycobacteriaceae bacterium]|nr:hypothetical protein [Mycobacteriaceae bacterium]